MMDTSVPPILQRLLTQPKQRVIPRWIFAPGVGPIAGGGTISADGVIEFQQRGYLVGFTADAIDPATGEALEEFRAALRMKVETFGQQTALTTNGQSAEFIPISLMMVGTERIWPCVRQVQVNDKLRVTFRNMAVTQAILPVAAAAFVSDLDWAQESITSGKLAPEARDV